MLGLEKTTAVICNRYSEIACVGVFYKRKWALVLISSRGCETPSFALFHIYMTEMCKARKMTFTPPEDSFLGSHISLQLSCSDVDADRLR